MNKKLYFFILVLIFGTINIINIPVFGVNDTIFTEGFENGELPDNWSNVMVVGHFGTLVPWKYTGDGYKVGSISFYPDTTAFGEYNARFDFQSYNHEATKLVTPKLNMTGRSKVVLSFWHAQATWEWDIPEWDVLKVYYKKDSVWNLLESYDVAVEDWVKHEILIPDNALSNSFYIAFEATTNYGYGVCIDDVKLIETGSEPRFIYSVNSSQPDLSYVPSGTTKNVILRTDIFVAGNNTSKLLQWMDVKSLNTSDADIETGGVKIYYTSDTVFDNKTPIGSGSFSSGTAHITLGNKALKTGNNSIWVTYDVKSTATPKNTLDAMIQASKISISDSLYPSTSQSPSGSRIIKETMFFDDFETNKGWTLYGDFERRKPQGLGGYRGSGSWGAKDPSEAFSDTTIIGTDLSGLPDTSMHLSPAQETAHKGNYEYSASYNSTYAVSPAINCYYYKNVTLRFQRQMSVYRFDNAEIDISTDNGATWTTYWNNDKSYSEDHWNQQIMSLTDYADRYQQVRVRFSIGPAGSLNKAAGWNIDDFIFTGDYITKDVGVTEWLTPKTNCGLGNETVSVVVKNFANVASVSTIPLRYTIDGTHYYYDTLHRSIPANDTAHFAFSHKYDFSNYDYYNTISVSTILSTDEDTRNDGINTTLYSLPHYPLPHLDNFDNAIDFWLPGPPSLHDTWERGTPSKSIIKNSASNPNSWVTKLYFYEPYPNNDSSYIESPCYDFSNAVKPIFEFKYTSDLEATKDGVALYYSIDNGTSWHFIPKHSYSWTWNWYTCNNIAALKTAGWDTLTNGNWITGKQVLPSILAGKSSVKFRFLFMSDSVNTYDGFGVDDVNVYEAPAIAGMKSINSHHTACQYINPDKISFSIKNNGIRTMYPLKDTIFAGFKINSGASILDTIQLTDSVRVGDTLMLMFHKNANVTNPGAYNIKVFTINRFRNFYPLPDNDTSQLNITIYANPVTNLADTFKTARLDTFTIRPYFSSSYLYRWSNATHDPLSTATTLHNPPSGKIWLKVTINDVTNCTTTDTFYVKKLIPNVGVKTLIDPHNACELGNSVYFKFSIKNYGDDTMRVNDTIRVGYKIDGQSIKYEDYKVTSRFYPGDTIIHTFTSSPANFTTIGSYTIKSFTAYKYDSIYGNDTLNSTVNVWGYPTVSIGPDTTVMGFYILHTDKIFKTYLWDNKSSETNSTYVVRSIGNHWVYVTDNHDCPAYDTAYIVVHIHDLQPTRISEPISDCSIGTNQKVKLTISNCGTDTVTMAESVPVGYSLDGGTWVNETISLSDSLFPGDSIEHQFNQNEDFSAIKTYTFKAEVNLFGDIDPSNDTIMDHVYVYGYPVVNLGPDTIVKAVQYTLSAPVGATYAYLWQNDSTYRQYIVTNSGKFYVRVTETLHNCVSSDTAYVTLSILDGSITQISTDSGCRNTFDSLQVLFMNKGNIDIPSTDSITLACKINGAAPVISKHKLTVPLAPNGTFWHTFKNLASSVVTGSNNLEIYPEITGDLRPENDTLSKIFTINLPPNVNLGGVDDTIKTRPPFMLDAGTGCGFTYLWQDNSTNQTFTVNAEGYYHVRVTNCKGCTGEDSVYVYFLVYDGGITNVTGVSSACMGVFNQFQATFTNLGRMTYNSGDTIKFNYKVNGSVPYSEAYRLISTLNPGEKVNHTFLNLQNKVDTGKNTFKVYSVVKTDDYPSDDTLNYAVTIKALPVIKLVNGKDTVGFKTSYIIDAGAGFTSYLWNTSETSRSIRISTPGWYKVTVTNSDGCQNKDSVYMTNTAIKYAADIDNALQVFPNPANTSVNIEIRNAGLEDPTIEIFSTDMKLIFTYTYNGKYDVFTKSMDVRNWKPGLYYFRIEDVKNNKYYFRKLVIE